MSTPPILMLPSMLVRAWSPLFPDAPMYEASTLEEWREPQKTDAMAAMYAMPPGVEFDPKQPGLMPRLGTAAFAHLKAQGREPVLAWAMLDVDRPGHEPWASIQDADTLINELLPKTGLLATAGFYSTRAGFRILWALSGPPLPVSKARGFLTALGKKIEAPLRALGYSIDPCSYEPHRLMRTPQATRDAAKGPLDPVWLLDAVAGGETLDPWIEGLVPSESEDFAVPASNTYVLPEAPPAVTTAGWAAAVEFPWLRHGGPIPPDRGGHTYSNMRQVLAQVASRGMITDPEVLLGICWASVLATPGRTLDEAWRYCMWLAEAQASTVAEYDALPDVPEPEPAALTNEALQELGIAALRKSKAAALFQKIIGGGPLGRTKAEGVSNARKAVETLYENLPSADPRQVYAMLYPSLKSMTANTTEVWQTVKEVAKIARDPSEIDPERMAKAAFADLPLVIKVVNGAWYCLNLRKGIPEYVVTDVVSLVHDVHKNVAPYVDFPLNIGALSEKTVLDRYGATAAKAVYISGTHETRFNRDNNQVEIGVHALMPFEALYDQDVEDWLNALGGGDSEALKDWIAAVPMTRKNIAALYLHGIGGTGKSLLATGIATMFGGAIVGYDKLMGSQFLNLLLETPLVFADEGIRLTKDDATYAAERFREVVTSSTFQVEQKHRSVEMLYGALRFIIASNKPDALPFVRGLTRTDLDAIVERIMYIKCGNEAKQILEKISAKNGGLSHWIGPGNSPGALAKHFLWLHRNREITPGPRLFVQGRLTDWHRNFAYIVGDNPNVLNVIAKMVQQNSAALAIRDRMVWVPPAKIMDNYKIHNDTRAPRLEAIRDALKSMAADPEDTRFKISNGQWARGYGIPLKILTTAGYLEEADIKKLLKNKQLSEDDVTVLGFKELLTPEGA